MRYTCISTVLTWTLLLPCPVGTGFARAATTAPTTTQASPRGRTIAVLTFKNLKTDKKTDWVGEGAAETLTTKLAGVPGLVVVERNQVRTVLDEQTFQKTDLTDPGSAVKVGRALGAERIVIGSFADEAGTLMFNVRVVDVQSAVVLSAATVKGKSTAIFDTLIKVTEAVIRSFDKKVVSVGARAKAVDAPSSERITLTGEEKKRLRKQGTSKTKAYTAFAKGMATSNPDDRIRWLTEAIRHDPKYVYAYNNRGNAYSDKGRYDRAIQDYDKALSLDPEHTTSYRNRGIVYQKRGLYDRAIQDYERAIRLDPRYPLNYHGRAVAYASKNQYSRAIRDYNRTLSLKPDYALAYHNRGLAYAKLGQLDRAIKDYDTALLLDPTYAKGHYNKGLACERVGRRIEAIAAYRRFIQLSGDGRDSKVRLAKRRLATLMRR
jgi:Tfp pilus assembly protein PilF/TolB-like protein